MDFLTLLVLAIQIVKTIARMSDGDADAGTNADTN